MPNNQLKITGGGEIAAPWNCQIADISEQMSEHLSFSVYQLNT